MSQSYSYSNEKFTPPSEEILNLFRTTYPSSQSMAAQVELEKDKVCVNPPPEIETAFAEDEYELLPTTFVKAIRRTEELLEETERIKKMSINVNNELKSIYGLIVRYGKKQVKLAQKSAQESSPTNQKATGFCRPGIISNEMCDFMEIERGTMKSRVEVNNFIVDYIKTNGLVSQTNAQHIIPDDNLRKLLSENAFEDDTQITYFSLQKYIKHHFNKKTN